MQLLSFDQVYFKHEQSQVLSTDLHVQAIGSMQQIQDAANVHWVYRINTIVGMRLDQRSYCDSWKLVGRHWRYQQEIWIGEKKLNFTNK